MWAAQPRPHRRGGVTYWASWADSLQSIARRFGSAFPEGVDLVQRLEHGSTETSIVAARGAAVFLDECDFARPSWSELVATASFPVDALPEDDRAEEPELDQWRHGWQYRACDAVERAAFRDLWARSSLSSRARLLSQCGPAASVWLFTLPCTFAFKPRRFVTALRLRLQLPVPLAGACCPGKECRQALDVWGFHLLSCMLSGRVQSRANPLERMWAQVGVEAGVRGRHNVPIGELGIEGLDPADHRRLDTYFNGCEAFGALPIVGDATIRSPLTAVGTPHPGAHEVPGSTFPRARYDKNQKPPRGYRDVAQADGIAFLVLACETGGRWSSECLELVRALAKWKVRDVPPALRTSFRLAHLRRWWGLLSCTLQDTVAATLDPTDRYLQGGFLPIDEIDTLQAYHEPPLVSRLV